MKRSVWKKTLGLLLTVALGVSLTCFPASAAHQTQAGDIPCPKCNQYDMVEEIVQPTCTQSGGCYWTCQNCGTRCLMVGRPDWNALNQSALGHNFENGICTRCGISDPTYTPPAPETQPDDNSDSDSESSDSQICTHQWNYQTVAATCTQPGEYSRTCSLCKEHEILRTDPVIDHQYQLTNTIPATSQQEGKKIYTCSVCGTTYEEKISKLPTPNPDPIVPEDPTCSHHWKYETTAATCVQPGEYYRTCSLCGTREVIRTTPTSSHRWRYETVSATCSKEGQYIRICTVCNEQELVRTLPKSSHRWSYSTTPATCSQEGQSIRTCSVCDTVEVLNTTPKLQHKYVSSIDRPATTTQTGLLTYTCSLCQDQYTESIPKLGGTQESVIQKDPNAQATASKNLGANSYSYYSSAPMKSYLYQRSDGGFTRVEAVNGMVVIEAYDEDFELLTSSSVPMELSRFGGFFAGIGYNFLIFGQDNTGDSSSKEVIRVVKYSKDWDRLGQASLKGANTHSPFDAGSLRCTEYNGMLYVHTCHTMFTSSRDGLNHQANMIFSIRQSDMSITDSQYQVSAVYEGYVSHSFNQFILVDSKGRIVTVNHGDAMPRGAILLQYDLPAGEDTFINYNVRSVKAMDFVKSSRSYNYTGACLGGLEASDSHYLLALSSVQQKDDVELYKTYNVMLAVTNQEIPKSYSTQTGLTNLVQLTHYSEGGTQSAGVPQMVKLSDNKFLLLWNIQTKDSYGYYRNSCP
ncbi:MAG: hypothetical protein ACOX7N_10110 [Lawsonibacter sp.]|jgi:hypothetical protein